jgi:hypothetical protein
MNASIEIKEPIAPGYGALEEYPGGIALPIHAELDIHPSRFPGTLCCFIKNM